MRELFSFFYKKLTVDYVKCVLKTPNLVVVKTSNGYKGVAWNVDTEFSGKKFDIELEFTDLLDNEEEENYPFSGDFVEEKKEILPNVLITMLVDASRIWIFRFVTLYICSTVLHMGVESVWYSVVVSNATSAVILYCLYWTGIWKKPSVKIK